MTKSKKALMKLTATMLTVVLCLCMTLPAFANEEKADPVIGSEQNPAATAITKALRMAIGATTPDLTFTFDFEPLFVNEVSATDVEGAAGYAPPVPSVKVEFTAADTGVTEDGVKIVRKESANPFVNIPWPHAGVYVYRVTERDEGKQTLTDLENLYYSKAAYTITVYVANGNDGLFVAAIGTRLELTDGDPAVDPGDKVDGRPGGNPAISGDWSKVIFTNTFTKTTGTGDPDNSTLAISKHVRSHVGDMFDTANREQYFDFDVMVTRSAVNINPDQRYIAYVVTADGVVQNISPNYTGTPGIHPTHGPYIEFTTGVPKTIRLKHGQWLSFVDLEIGAIYTATERGVANFTPSYTHTVNGEPTTVTGMPNTDLTITTSLITEGEDSVAFLNTYRQVTPVGVFVDNLPFVVLIGLGLAGIILLATLKNRKREEETC